MTIALLFWNMALYVTRIPKRRGFTLIEMTIVLVIILAFLAMSVPFFANFSSSTGINTATREISTLLRTARSYAITQNSDYNAVFDTTTVPNRFWIYDPAPPGEAHIVGKGLSLPTGVTFSAPVTVIFTSTGGITGGADVTITISNAKGKTKSIKVYQVTGMVEIQ
jgi:prepilin-type N-terminal cleavage/methylation domain-containing protein